MFTWICPKCGTEVPPSYNDCPNCAAREKAAAAPPPPAPAPAPAPVQVTPVYQAPAPVAYTPPAPAPAPAPAPYVQPPLVGTVPTEPALPPTFSFGGGGGSTPSSYDAAPPAPAGGLPSWLIAVLSIVGVAALGYGVFHFASGRNGAAAETAAVDTLPKVTGNSPLGKYIEVVGFRIVEDKQKVQLKFLIVNHSAGEIAPFDLLLEVRTKNQKADEAPLFTVKTPVSGVLPFEAKDMTIPVKTSMRAYEIPDWQFLTATFDIEQK